MLDASNKKPLYYQLYETLLDFINEELKENDKLPTEKEICIEYNVSRTTVRLALNELQKRGYIYSLQGKGSFVTGIRKNTINSFISLDLRSHFNGENFSNLDLKFSKILVEPIELNLRQKIGLNSDTLVLKFSVKYYIDKDIVCKETFILKKEYFNHFNISMIKEHGMDILLKENNIEIKNIQESYEIIKIDELIERNALKITKEYYNENNEIIIIIKRIILTDKILYSNSFSANNN